MNKFNQSTYNPEIPPTEARDWGRLEYQTELLEYIDTATNQLDERDAEGHLWWAKFKELVNKVKP